MPPTVKKSEIDRNAVMKLAGESGLDPRTVERAVKRGVDALRAGVDRDRLRAAAEKLGLELR